MKMTEARNYLYKLAEGKEAQRRKDLAFWDGIIEALGLVPRTQIVESLIKFCGNRRALFTEEIRTGCSPEVTFFGAMLEEMNKYKGMTEEEMLRVVISANAPKPVMAAPAPAPIVPTVIPAPVPSKPVVAGEIDDTSDMDDDEDLDGQPSMKGNPEI